MVQTKLVGPMPQIGYGTWRRTGDTAVDCVTWALEAGYRHIDTAQGYANEEFVGRAIAESGLGRPEIFVTTKVAPDHLGPGSLRPSVEVSLEKLRTDQVDLLLIHWPSAGDRVPLEAYLAQLAEVYDAGLTRFIGVSNFTRRHIDRALELVGDRPILVNQVEIHPFLQNHALVEHCRRRDIAMTAYCPIARALVSEDRVMQEIATVHEASSEQISLAFLLAEGHVVIPSSANRGRIAANLAARDIALDEEEIARIRGLDRGARLVNPDFAPEWDA